MSLLWSKAEEPLIPSDFSKQISLSLAFLLIRTKSTESTMIVTYNHKLQVVYNSLLTYLLSTDSDMAVKLQHWVFLHKFLCRSIEPDCNAPYNFENPLHHMFTLPHHMWPQSDLTAKDTLPTNPLRCSDFEASLDFARPCVRLTRDVCEHVRWIMGAATGNKSVPLPSQFRQVFWGFDCIFLNPLASSTGGMMDKKYSLSAAADGEISTVTDTAGPSRWCSDSLSILH